MATLCATALSACGQASSPAATTGPVSVGISLSLSGDFADPGRAALRGYQLWADSVNGGGGILGRRLQLTVLDDHSDPARAARNYRTLITRDKVNLVLGPFSTLLTAPSATIAHRYGYAFIEPAGGGPAVFQAKLDNVFFAQPAPAVKNADVLASYILSLPK